MDRTQLRTQQQGSKKGTSSMSSLFMRRKGIWGTLQSAPQMSFPIIPLKRIKMWGALQGISDITYVLLRCFDKRFPICFYNRAEGGGAHCAHRANSRRHGIHSPRH